MTSPFSTTSSDNTADATAIANATATANTFTASVATITVATTDGAGSSSGDGGNNTQWPARTQPSAKTTAHDMTLPPPLFEFAPITFTAPTLISSSSLSSSLSASISSTDTQFIDTTATATATSKFCMPTTASMFAACNTARGPILVSEIPSIAVVPNTSRQLSSSWPPSSSSEWPSLTLMSATRPDESSTNNGENFISETPATVTADTIDWHALQTSVSNPDTSTDVLLAMFILINDEIDRVKSVGDANHLLYVCMYANDYYQGPSYSYDECTLMGHISVFFTTIVQHHSTKSVVVQKVYEMIHKHIKRTNNHSHHFHDLMYNALLSITQKNGVMQEAAIVVQILMMFMDYRITMSLMDEERIPNDTFSHWLGGNDQLESLIDLVLTYQHKSFAVVTQTFRLFKRSIRLHIAGKSSTRYRDTGKYQHRSRNGKTLVLIDRTHFSRLTFGTLDVLATAHSTKDDTVLAHNDGSLLNIIGTWLLSLVQQCTNDSERHIVRAYLLQRDHVNILSRVMQYELATDLFHLMTFMCFARRNNHSGNDLVVYRIQESQILAPFFLAKIQAMAQPNDNDSDDEQQATHVIDLPNTDYDCDVANVKLVAELMWAHVDNGDILTFLYTLMESCLSQKTPITELLFARGFWDLLLKIVQKESGNGKIHSLFGKKLVPMIPYQTKWTTFIDEHLDWIIDQSNIDPTMEWSVATNILLPIMSLRLTQVSDNNNNTNNKIDNDTDDRGKSTLIELRTSTLSSTQPLHVHTIRTQSPTHAASTGTTSTSSTMTMTITATNSLWARLHDPHVVVNCLLPYVDDASFYLASRVNRHTYDDRHGYAVKSTMSFRRVLRIPSVVRAMKCVISGESCDHIVLDVHYPRIVRLMGVPEIAKWTVLLPHIIVSPPDERIVS